ncbi:MAG: prephenate dehydrogenase [Ruminococcus sp.]
MNILVSGMGLIGGSFCKALKKYTNHTVTGYDINKDIEKLALSEKSIDRIFNGDYSDFDIIIVCMYPEITEKYFCETIPQLNKNTLITDVCGIKGEMSERIHRLAEHYKIEYIPIHPMAGKEVGGYSNSTADLYIRANMVITPFSNSDKSKTAMLSELAENIGFRKIVVTTPQEHDEMIAYTSQLAHIVSSAYVKSPSLDKESGFSGGSFQDMTRIATMNENMWTSLFMQNRKTLEKELSVLIENLEKYRKALSENDSETMKKLIKEGSELKYQNLKKRVGESN